MWRLILVLAPTGAWADSMVATHTIRAQSVLSEADFTMVAADIPGAVQDPDAALGQEARVTLYAGRPIRPDDLGAPALVDRNQVVTLIFQSGGLSIMTEGRALARGGVGDFIKVLNIASHTTITGQIMPNGVVSVGPSPQG